MARAFIQFLKLPIAHELFMAQGHWPTPHLHANPEAYDNDTSARSLGAQLRRRGLSAHDLTARHARRRRPFGADGKGLRLFRRRRWRKRADDSDTRHAFCAAIACARAWSSNAGAASCGLKSNRTAGAVTSVPVGRGVEPPATSARSGSGLAGLTG